MKPRDRLAAAVVSQSWGGAVHFKPSVLARRAYRIADAMLFERSKQHASEIPPSPRYIADYLRERFGLEPPTDVVSWVVEIWESGHAGGLRKAKRQRKEFLDAERGARNAIDAAQANPHAAELADLRTKLDAANESAAKAWMQWDPFAFRLAREVHKPGPHAPLAVELLGIICENDPSKPQGYEPIIGTAINLLRFFLRTHESIGSINWRLAAALTCLMAPSMHREEILSLAGACSEASLEYASRKSE